MSSSESFCDSSDFSDYEEIEGTGKGLKPYMFEPLASRKVDKNRKRVMQLIESHSVSDRDKERNEDTTYWCLCGCCTVGCAPENRFCCQEDEKIFERIHYGQRETSHKFKCITLHPSFEAVCLNVDVLRVAYFQMRQNGQAEKHSEDEAMRYTAYRQLIHWCYGWLGKYNRKPLPSCAMHKIREQFPAASGQYKGFRFVDRQ